jgi:tetratricopeptide (TPR) repeat protein
MLDAIDAETAALLNKAQNAAKSGNPQLAGDLWERVLANRPTHAGALLALAQLRYRSGRLEEARGLLERLVRVATDDKQHWINLAVVCMAQRDEAGEAEAIRR